MNTRRRKVVVLVGVLVILVAALFLSPQVRILGRWYTPAITELGNRVYEADDFNLDGTITLGPPHSLLYKTYRWLDLTHVEIQTFVVRGSAYALTRRYEVLINGDELILKDGFGSGGHYSRLAPPEKPEVYKQSVTPERR